MVTLNSTGELQRCEVSFFPSYQTFSKYISEVPTGTYKKTSAQALSTHVHGCKHVYVTSALLFGL